MICGHGESVLLVLYAHDSLICARTIRAIDKIIVSLKAQFCCPGLGQSTQFLGMTVSYFQDQGVLALSEQG